MNEILGIWETLGETCQCPWAERRMWRTLLCRQPGTHSLGVQAEAGAGETGCGAREMAEQLLLQRTRPLLPAPTQQLTIIHNSSSQDPVPEGGLSNGADRFCPFSFPPLLNIPTASPQCPFPYLATIYSFLRQKTKVQPSKCIFWLHWLTCPIRTYLVTLAQISPFPLKNHSAETPAAAAAAAAAVCFGSTQGQSPPFPLQGNKPPSG